jgi:hypothetical protein
VVRGERAHGGQAFIAEDDAGNIGRKRGRAVRSSDVH